MPPNYPNGSHSKVAHNTILSRFIMIRRDSLRDMLRRFVSGGLEKMFRHFDFI